jgi:hypothetical protein
MEALLPTQTHRAQGGADSPSVRGEDRSYQQDLGISPDAPGESGANDAKSRIIGVGRVRTLRSPLLAETGDERILPLSPTNG